MQSFGRRKWEEVIDWCGKNNISVGIIGSAPKLQQDEYNSDGCEEY